MDEKTWLKGESPEGMATHLLTVGSGRKLRLLACAAALRSGWELSPQARKVVEAALTYADDPAGYSTMLAARGALERRHTSWDEDEIESELPETDTWARSCGLADARDAVRAILCQPARGNKAPRSSWSVDLIQEVFGNPFRSYTIDPLWLSAHDHAVGRLAYAIYREQDFGLMPMLADALEDAGCEEQAILEHLRCSTTHVRGCWALDLILGDRPQLALPVVEMLQIEEIAGLSTLPHAGWLVTLAEGQTLPESLKEYRVGALPRECEEAVLTREILAAEIRSQLEVTAVKEIYYFTKADGRKRPKVQGKGRAEQGPSGWVLLFATHEEAMEALTSVYPPAQLLKILRSTGQREAQRLARAAWKGDRVSLRILVNLLEESGHKEAPILRQVVGGTAREQRVADGRLHDAELMETRKRLSKEACPGCNTRREREVFRVQKEGPNKDRLFVRCPYCDHFDWLTEAKQDASSRSADLEVEAIQKQAGACPQCGQSRHALRVRKEGPNRGRIFLSCSDHTCGNFEWASPAPQVAGNPEDSSPCEKCGQPAVLRQVRKQGPNQGRYFRKCDHCGAFHWEEAPPSPSD